MLLGTCCHSEPKQRPGPWSRGYVLFSAALQVQWSLVTWTKSSWYFESMKRYFCDLTTKLLFKSILIKRDGNCYNSRLLPRNKLRAAENCWGCVTWRCAHIDPCLGQGQVKSPEKAMTDWLSASGQVLALAHRRVSGSTAEPVKWNFQGSCRVLQLINSYTTISVSFCFL